IPPLAIAPELVAIFLLSGDQARVWKKMPDLKIATACSLSTSQTSVYSLSAPLAAAIRLPSGDHATCFTSPSAGIVCFRSPVETSHIFTELSAELPAT